MDLNALQPGQTLFEDRMTLSAEDCAAYRDAVEDGCVIHAEERIVPPMAVVALVMGAAMRSVGLPAGAVHTGQEVDFLRAIPEGAVLECSASVAQNSVRRGSRFLTLEVRALAEGQQVVSGRASIAIQEGDGD